MVPGAGSAKFCAEALPQQDAAAGDQMSGLRQRMMTGQEIRPRDAVAVQEDEIGPPAGLHGSVQDLRPPKAVVLMPDVPYRDGRVGGERLDHRPCLLARPVVGDHDLEVPVGLRGERGQGQPQRRRPVIGVDDDRNHRVGVRRSQLSRRQRRRGLRENRGYRILCAADEAGARHAIRACTGAVGHCHFKSMIKKGRVAAAVTSSLPNAAG